jgi:nucleoside-triphosphatase THEP1
MRNDNGPSLCKGHLVILSGLRGSGKTTACLRLIERARQRGLNCAGIISPARFQDGRKVGIDVLDVGTGERRALAEADQLPGELRTTAFRFDTRAVEWGADRLNVACPCDVLIVDELGPLELERGQGWVNVLDVLRDGEFKLAVVVVRPELVPVFQRALPDVLLPVFRLESLENQLDILVSLSRFPR